MLETHQGSITINCDGYLCKRKELHDFVMIDVPDTAAMDFCSLKCLKRWLDYEADPNNRKLQTEWWDGKDD